MAHMRATIRAAVAAALASAGTLAGTRVHDSPYIARKELPALSVEDAGAHLSDGVTEQQQAITMPAGADRTIKRLYRFVVVAEILQNASYAADRDTLVGQVEACIASLAIPGVKSISPVGYQAADDNSTGKPARQGIQIFEALYFTSQGDPTTPR